MTTPVTEVHNRMADYIPSTGDLLIAGKNGVSNSAGINMFWGAYEPRVGLTWKVLGSDKTVVRLGFGIYHDSSWNQGAQGLWQNPPTLGESDQLPNTFSTGCAFATSYCAYARPDTRVDQRWEKFHPFHRFSLVAHPAGHVQLCGHIRLPANQLPAGPGTPI